MNAQAMSASTFASKRLIISTGNNTFCFGTYLFSIDQNIKEYPHRLCGTGASAEIGLQLRRSFSISVEGSKNSASGNGGWLDTGDIDPQEAAFAPVATGETRLQIRGLLGVARKSFRFGKVHPYAEMGAGVGDLTVSFNGTASAVDPTDEEAFTTPANDVVRRRIPMGVAGGGLEIPLRPAFSFQAGYRWEEGSAATAGVRYYFSFWQNVR